jgi:hypothetical protein
VPYFALGDDVRFTKLQIGLEGGMNVDCWIVLLVVGQLDFEKRGIELNGLAEEL